MEEIANLLVELLRSHDRVSLPGMGAFVATSQPARIANNRMSPPSKKVEFLRSETWNDGLLELLYAERFNRTPEEARECLRGIILDIHYGLDSNGKFVLPNFGTLKQTPSRDISFTLNKNINLQDESFGLDDLPIDAPTPNTSNSAPSKPLPTPKPHCEINIPVKKSSANPVDDLTGPTRSKNAQLLIFGLLLVAIIAILMVQAMRKKGNNSVEELYANMPATEQVGVLAEEPDTSQHEAPAKQSVAPTEYFVHQPHAPAVLSSPKAAPRQAAPAKTSSGKDCVFCTIIASFPQLEQARLTAKKYAAQGYATEVKDSGKGTFRVALGCFSSYDLAKRLLDSIAPKIKDAWILEVCE